MAASPVAPPNLGAGAPVIQISAIDDVPQVPTAQVVLYRTVL